MTAARTAVLRHVADLVPRSGRRLVGIDGVDGSGKTTFADELAAVLELDGRTVIRVSADDFHNTREVRHRLGRDSPEGFWLDSYDYAALRAKVLDPLGPGGGGVYCPLHHDVRSDALLEPVWQTADDDAMVVVDGLFLHRDELLGVWDLSVFLDVPFEVTAVRMAMRDGTSPDPSDPFMARYVEGQRLYFASCRPWTRADIVVDNSDLARPCIAAPP